MVGAIPLGWVEITVALARGPHVLSAERLSLGPMGKLLKDGGSGCALDAWELLSDCPDGLGSRC